MRIVGKEELDVCDIKGALLERQPLPIGRIQFHEWADRIIAAANVNASERSLKNTLAVMLMHLGPTEAFKEDGYFVLALRKAAVQETAHAMMVEYQEQKKAEETAPKPVSVNVLENQSI